MSKTIVCQRVCRSDENGLLSIIPLSSLWDFIDKESNITKFYFDLYIPRLKHTITFDLLFNSACKKEGFSDKMVDSFFDIWDEYLMIKENNKTYNLSVRLDLDVKNSCIRIYDNFYYRNFTTDKLSNPESELLPVYLGNIYSDISADYDGTKYDENSAIVQYDELSNVILRIIFPGDCMYNKANDIVIDELSYSGGIKLLEKDAVIIDKKGIRSLEKIMQRDKWLQMFCEIKKLGEQLRTLQRSNSRRYTHEIVQLRKKLCHKVDYYYRTKQKLHYKMVREYLKFHEFKYYSSICLLIRDENEYLEEWLDN